MQLVDQKLKIVSFETSAVEPFVESCADRSIKDYAPENEILTYIQYCIYLE
jgi:hypothetical protein